MKIIVFSKNRPWQLKEYLRTLHEYAYGTYDVSVIYNSDDEYKDRYEKLKELSPTVSFYNENCPADFCKQLFHLFLSSDAKHIMFGTDDVLWYNDFSLNIAEACLNNNPECFGYSYRLHENIKYCHPANQWNIIPPLRYSSGGYMYNTTNGSIDWAYPFEIGATVYRQTQIAHLIGHLQKFLGSNSISNPNRLEANMSTIVGQFKVNACYNKPVCSVITVNRVQNEYNNPVYPLKLDKDLNDLDFSTEYDCNWYKNQNFDRIHIGEVKLK